MNLGQDDVDVPIVSRQLEHIRPQRDGTVRVQERLTDSKGRVWFHSYKESSVTVATARMNARDLTDQLKEADFTDLLEWVQAKNLPGDFDFTDRDLVLLTGEELLLIWFAEKQGGKAITLAWWIENLGPPAYDAIRIRAGFDAATGSRIQDRAIDLATVEPRFDAVEEVD